MKKILSILLALCLLFALAACGGQDRSTDTILTTDSSLAADTLPVADTASPDEDTVYPEVTTTGLILLTPESLEIPPPPQEMVEYEKLIREEFFRNVESLPIHKARK